MGDNDKYKYYLEKVEKYFNRCLLNGEEFEKNFSNVRNMISATFNTMANDQDKRFIDVLIDTISVDSFDYTDMVCWSKDNFPFFNPHNMSYLVRFYIAAVAYLKNGYNIENYTCIMNDVKNFPTYTGVYDLNNKFIRAQDDIDLIVGNRLYKDLPNLRKNFALLFNSFGWKNGFFDIKKYNCIILKILSDAYELGIDEEKVIDIVDKMLGNDGVLFVSSRPYFYSKILLIGDRFSYVNEKFLEIEKNFYIRRDIFQYIDNLSIEMFDEINTKSEDDSFMSYLDSVFNSDSYAELLSKLECLKEAGELYVAGEKESAFLLIDDVESCQHKKDYCGKVVSYPLNPINPVEKPKTILDREKQLYMRIDGSLSYEFMNTIHYDSYDLDTFYNNINIVLERERSPFNIFKRKFKSKISEMKRGG